MNPSSAGDFALYPPLPLISSEMPARRSLRICIASFDFVGPVRNGGVGTAFTSLGEALAAAGHAVTFLYLSGRHCETKQPLEHWISDYKHKGIDFVPMPDQSGPRLDTPWHMAKAYEAYAWLRGKQFDVVHFSEWRAPGYYALVAKHQGLAFHNCLLCVHTHGPTLWSLLSNGEYLAQLAELELDFMERESVRLADVVASPSQYLLRWMHEQQWTLPAQTYVQQYVRPSAAKPAKTIADSGPVREIVFFGRLEVRKGLVLFCDALDRLKGDSELSALKVTFLGKITTVNGMPGEDYLRRRIGKWPWACQILSDLDQAGAVAYLQGVGRIAVIPSMVDNLPNTVLECLGARVPFLASTTGGIPEMINTEDGADILFPLRAAPLAEKMRRAVREGLRTARFAVEPDANRNAWLRWHGNELAELSTTTSPRVPESDGPPPLVSVCISHFNRPDYLRQALASVEAQQYPNYEIVLVDDASTKPEAIAYIDSLAAKFVERGWQLIRNSEELFVGAARNVAARHARGEYLKFMDDDNVAKPHELATFVKVARHTGADIVTCALDVFSEETAPKPDQKPLERFLFLGAAVSAGALRNYFGDTNALFRREVFLKLGGFHEVRHVGMEDWKLIASAVLKGYRLEVLSDSLVWYRRTAAGDNASVKNSLQAGHMQYLEPFLDAVPPALRNLVLYAQGASLRQGPVVNEAAVNQLIQQTVLWRSKLEAALIFVEKGQDKIAAKLMLDGVISVQNCKNVRVILEALLTICPHLAKLDAGRARYLLNLAAETAEKTGQTADLERARRSLAELQPVAQRLVA